MPAEAAEELPNCRLFLLPPSGLDADRIAACVAAAAKAGDVACLVLPSDKDVIGKVMHRAQEDGIAVLIADDARAAAYAKADGVHVTTSRQDAEAARKSLGQKASIGLLASDSRHAAMEAGEGSIDYIGFDLSSPAGQDLLEWWTPLFEVPAVGLNSPDEDCCIDAMEAGADFVMPPAAMWDSPEAAGEIAARLTAAGRRNPS